MTATTVRARLQNWYWPADAALRQRRLEQLNLTVGGTRGTLKPAFVNHRTPRFVTLPNAKVAKS